MVLGAQGERRGLMRLAHDFDVCPAMLTKREVKQLFSAVCRFRGSMQGVDYDDLVRVLGLMAVTALNKPSFHHLYPTNQSKVTVLLEMWGLADPIKLQVVRQHATRARGGARDARVE